MFGEIDDYSDDVEKIREVGCTSIPHQPACDVQKRLVIDSSYCGQPECNY